MKKFNTWLTKAPLIGLMLSAMLANSAPETPSVGHHWLQVEVGIIGAASDDILKQALAEVTQKKLTGLIIVLDTPGGTLDSTRSMVKEIMAAPFPVVVWVGPSGARAGSAGAFITIAGHVAAMAPGSNIGAAHPVQAGGKEVESKPMADKILNDTVAFIESIATQRGRNIEMARSFVAMSASITAEEALENNVIDYIASDVPSLLVQLKGKEIALADNSKVVLDQGVHQLVPYKKTFRQKALEILSNPNLFYLLFLAGIIGIGFELTHPGSIFPGVFGGISMILALIATSVLPVSWGAATLILVGIALLIAEAFVPSFGILGIGGFLSFVIGSIFLVDPSGEHGLRISWFYIAPGSVMIAAIGLLIGYLVIRTELSPAISGADALPGTQGEAIENFVAGRGKIRVMGEIWQAQAMNEHLALKKGDKVQVNSREGLLLKVNNASHNHFHHEGEAST